MYRHLPTTQAPAGKGPRLIPRECRVIVGRVHDATCAGPVTQEFARVQPLQGNLPTVVSTSPWDGGEGVLQEEEFSLDDVMEDEL